ncbi:Mis6-domain-containing protein [Gongronella butleri]|nr:Mis6-domain-containing protein [Gongronella butleri]
MSESEGSVDNRLRDVTLVDEEITSDMVNFTNIDDYLDKKIGRLLRASRTKSPSAKEIATLVPEATKYGLRSSQISTILDIIFTQTASVSASLAMIRLLVPRRTVEESEITRIMGNLSCRDYPLEVMEALVIWTIDIYDFIASKRFLHNMYGVLFHYLSMERLRPWLCHLLYIMTQRHHVRPYRARYLVHLIDTTTPDPQLIGLYTLFRQYRPEMVGSPKRILPTKAVSFTTARPEWKNKMIAAQALWLDENTPKPFSDDIDDNGSISEPMANLAVSSKRRRDDELPHVPASTRARSRGKGRQAQRPADMMLMAPVRHDKFDVRAVLDLLENQDIPVLIRELLDNRMAQHLLACQPSDAVVDRIGTILGQQLLDLLYWQQQTDFNAARFKGLIEKVVLLTRFTRAQLPIMETFLDRFLPMWHGLDLTPEIFELLTYTSPMPFEDLYERYLRPLYRLFCVNDVRWKARLIMCYRDLLANWALLDWHRHFELREAVAAQQGAKGLRDRLTWPFHGLDVNIDYLWAMQQFIHYVDRLGNYGLLLEQDHPLLQHASLYFLEFYSGLSLDHNVPIIAIPKAAFVYRLFMSDNATTVSRLCGALARLKTAWQANDMRTDAWIAKVDQQQLDQFNAFIMDTCAALWRNDALDRSRSCFALTRHTIDKLIEKCEERGDPADFMFSLTHSTSFAGFSKAYMNLRMSELDDFSIQNNDSPATETKVMQTFEGMTSYEDFRVQYLAYLHDLGFFGLHDYLSSTISSLTQRALEMDEESDAPLLANDDDDEPLLALPPAQGGERSGKASQSSKNGNASPGSEILGSADEL